MPTTTPRLTLAQPIGSDNPAELRISTTGNMDTLDNAMMWLPPGVLSSRPLVSGQPSGTGYLATDTGTLSIGDGANWHQFSPTFSVVGAPSNLTAAPWTYVLAYAPPQTITLPPAPTVNAQVIVGTFGNTGTAPVTVTGGGQVIYGAGLNDASSFVLGTPSVSAWLLFDGSRWEMIAGQQDTGWVPLTLPSGLVTPGTGITLAETPSARLQGDTVQLKGGVYNQSAGSLAVIATVPSFAIPTKNIGGDFYSISITTSGQIGMVSGALSGGESQFFDGFSYVLS